MFIYKTKSDYAKKYERANVHTTIRKDKYLKFLAFNKEVCQEASQKVLDILISEYLDNKKFQEEIINKVKNY